MCIIICSFYSAYNNYIDYYIITFYWFLIINPIYEVLFKNKFDGKIEKPLTPVKVNLVERNLNSIFNKIPENSRIIFPAKDPKNIYEKLLDNHNQLLNPIAFYCLKNKIFFHPYNFSVIYDEPSTYQYWDTDLNDVLNNMEKNKFEYVLLKSDSAKIEFINSKKFEIVSKINWRNIFPYPLKEINLNPIWYLLKLKKNH